MSVEVASSLLPLLRQQPYIQSAAIWNEEPFDIDLDSFRQFGIGYNLADAHLIPLGLPPTCRDGSWIAVEFASSYEKRPVIFSRSREYRGIDQFWKAIYAEYGHLAAFVGLDHEYEAFLHEVGELPRIPTSNLLEVAQIIAGSKLFIGNQSCPLAIAEGLKHPLIQEVCLMNPNCLFFRERCFPVMAEAQLLTVFSEIRSRNIL